jgi:hypothetical protein
MSNRSDPTNHGPSAYAPRSVRRAETRQRRDVPRAYAPVFVDEIAEGRDEDEAGWVRGYDAIIEPHPRQDVDVSDRHDEWGREADPVPENDPYVDRTGASIALDPPDADPTHTLRVRRSQRGMLGVLGRLALAVSIAAIAALVIAQKSADWRNLAGAQRSGEPATAPTPAEPAANQSPSPQLVAVQSNVRGSSDELPLGLAVEGRDEGVTLVVVDLPAGSSLTTGREFGADAWRMAAADISRAMLRRPPGFTGPMDLIVELHLADDTVVDRRSLRLEWISPTPAPVAASVAPWRAAAAANGGAQSGGVQSAGVQSGGAQSAGVVDQVDKPERQLDAATIAELMSRADKFIAVGDISAARVLLRRAAEARDPRAAFALGATYDPIALEKLGVRGTAGDVLMARKWYDRAKELGSSEAQGRLEMLATTVR